MEVSELCLTDIDVQGFLFLTLLVSPAKGVPDEVCRQIGILKDKLRRRHGGRMHT